MLTPTQTQALLEVGYLTAGEVLEHLDAEYLDVEVLGDSTTLRAKLGHLGALTPIDERAVRLRDAILKLTDPRPKATDRRLKPQEQAHVHAGIYVAAMVALETAGLGWRERCGLRYVLCGGEHPWGPANSDWFTIFPTLGEVAATTDRIANFEVNWSRGPAPHSGLDGILAANLPRDAEAIEALAKVGFTTIRHATRAGGFSTMQHREPLGLARLANRSTAA